MKADREQNTRYIAIREGGKVIWDIQRGYGCLPFGYSDSDVRQVFGGGPHTLFPLPIPNEDLSQQFQFSTVWIIALRHLIYLLPDKLIFLAFRCLDRGKRGLVLIDGQRAGQAVAQLVNSQVKSNQERINQWPAAVCSDGNQSCEYSTKPLKFLIRIN